MTRKKTAVQLDAEIATVLAAGPPVKISVHAIFIVDDDEDDRYVVSDDGGEFDDSEDIYAPDVQGDIDDRRAHYRALGRRVVLNAPARGDWL